MRQCVSWLLLVVPMDIKQQLPNHYQHDVDTLESQMHSIKHIIYKLFVVFSFHCKTHEIGKPANFPQVFLLVQYIIYTAEGSNANCRNNQSALQPNSQSLTGWIKLTPAWGCRIGPPCYIGWQGGTTTLCRSQLYPPVRDYAFCY